MSIAKLPTKAAKKRKATASIHLFIRNSAKTCRDVHVMAKRFMILSKKVSKR